MILNEEIKKQIVFKFLQLIGEDPEREGLKDTPGRVVNMWEEIYKGYDILRKPKLTTFLNKQDGIDYNQMIIDKGYFFSQCEHHLKSFFGQYFFGYIPGRQVIGLSKIARLIDWYASKLQIQERLTKEVIDEFEKVVKPKGCILILKARHLCKEMRGIKQVNGEMITSEVRGVFSKEINTRQEFLSLIK